MVYEDIEDAKDHLMINLEEIGREIGICPSCRVYSSEVWMLRNRVSRIRGLSGLSKLLPSLEKISDILGKCRYCEQFAKSIYDLEHEIEDFLREKSPSVIVKEEPSLNLEKLEHLIRSQYPFPISYAYKNMQRARDSQQLDALINVFDVTLRYICYVLIADAFYRYQIRRKISLKKLYSPDLGPKGIGLIIKEIHNLIPPGNQFIEGLTTRFFEVESEYRSLYKLRCTDRHDTFLSSPLLSEIKRVDFYKMHVNLLRKFLEKLKILIEYRLAIVKDPTDFDEPTRSMVYEVLECVGDDPDFSEPRKIKISLHDLVCNSRVILIKDLSSSDPNNILQLFPLVVASIDKESGRYTLQLYHHYVKDENSFEFFGSTTRNVTFNLESDVYNQLYQMILM